MIHTERARTLLDSMDKAIKNPALILEHNFLVFKLLGPGDHWHLLKQPMISGCLSEELWNK